MRSACVQLACYLDRAPLLWMMPLHLHVNKKSDYDDDDEDDDESQFLVFFEWSLKTEFSVYLMHDQPEISSMIYMYYIEYAN